MLKNNLCSLSVFNMLHVVTVVVCQGLTQLSRGLPLAETGIDEIVTLHGRMGDQKMSYQGLILKFTPSCDSVEPFRIFDFF